MIVIGMMLAMVIHALYDFLLTLQIGIFVIAVMLVYFVGGFIILNYLFNKKEVDLKLGVVGTTIMPKEDFVKILNYVQDEKEKMEDRKPDKPISEI